MALIQFNKISKEFTGNYLLKDITFSIDENDRIGMVGENGAGKTTIIKIITGQENDSEDFITKKKGQISKKGNINIGYLSQNFDLDTEKTVFDELKSVFNETLEKIKRVEEINWKLPTATGKEHEQLAHELDSLTHDIELKDGYNVDYKIREVLNGLGLQEEFHKREIKDLSGGEKSRVSLAKLLLKEPELLILDEPTNHLDITSIEWLEKFLKSYKNAILVISHDKYFLNNVINRVFEIENKTLTAFSGNFDSYVKQKEELLERKIEEYSKQQKNIAKTEEFIRRYKAGVKSKQARGREKILNRMEKLDDPNIPQKRMSLNVEFDKKTSNIIYEAFDIGKTFEKKLFDDASFKIYRGEKIGLIGKNGTGKTTLLKILTGSERDFSGQLKRGDNLQEFYYDQHYSCLDFDKTLYQEIREHDKKITEEEILSIAARFYFTGDDLEKSIGSLSGGEKARVVLIKIILEKPNVLILDEPTNHLDIYTKEILIEGLSDYQGTIITVSHDREFLENVVEDILIVEDGKVKKFDGNYIKYKNHIENQNRKEVNNEEKKIDYVEQKKNKNRLKILERRYTDTEKLIEELDEKKSVKELSLNNTENSSDYTLLNDIQMEIDQIEEEILIKMEEWEEISSEIEKLKNTL